MTFLPPTRASSRPTSSDSRPTATLCCTPREPRPRQELFGRLKDAEVAINVRAYTVFDDELFESRPEAAVDLDPRHGHRQRRSRRRESPRRHGHQHARGGRALSRRAGCWPHAGCHACHPAVAPAAAGRDVAARRGARARRQDAGAAWPRRDRRLRRAHRERRLWHARDCLDVLRRPDARAAPLGSSLSSATTSFVRPTWCPCTCATRPRCAISSTPAARADEADAPMSSTPRAVRWLTRPPSPSPCASSRIAGAGLDVYTEEPLAADANPF